MHEPLLCREPQAAVPFVIEAAGIRVYSLEELCYYVVNNLSLVDGTFCSPELCRWIAEEARRPEVGEKLSMLLSEHAALHLTVGAMLSASGYVTQQQLRDVMTALASYEKQTPGERMKVAADRLLDHGRLQEAAFTYRRMLDEPEKYSVSMALWADIWNNLGTACARLFFFAEAAECFAQSYRRSRKESAARAMIAACLMTQDRRLVKTMAEKYEIPQSICDQAREAVEKIGSSAGAASYAGEPAQAGSDIAKLRALLREHEKEYRSQTS